MEYIRSADFFIKNTCVTLGKFDGLHLGHRLLLKKMKEWKKRNGTASVMFTFDFHPGMLFAKNDVTLLYTEEEKRKLLEENGLDVFIAYPFTRETSSMEAEDFIEQILVRQLDARMIVVGEDNHFGHNRRGDVKMLQRFSKEYGFEVIACEKVRYDGEIVSSTRVREALVQGRIELVNQLLQEPYHIRGVVVPGQKLGAQMGVATLNLVPPSDKLLPQNGVYVSRTTIDKQAFLSVTNIGTRPTVNDGSRILAETHLLEATCDCYGKSVKVELFHFMRKEQQFEDKAQLSFQMRRDIEHAKAWWNEKK